MSADGCLARCRVAKAGDSGLRTDTPVPPARVAWQRTARRLRVPLGFCFAALFLVLAAPSGFSLGASLLFTAPGLLLRAMASGHVKKNEALAVTGPYAWTRNPLYLGSMLISFGFALASRSVVLSLVLVTLFLAIYIPVILAEEQFLRVRFPEFAAYAAEVPRLLPRLTPARFAGSGEGRGGFSRVLWLQHREYNSLIGAAAIYAALILKMLTFGRS